MPLGNGTMSRERFLNAQLTQIAIVGVAVLGLVFFLTSGMALGDFDEPPIKPERLLELEAQRAIWQDRRPPTYSYRAQESCRCPREYTVPYAVSVSPTSTLFETSPRYAKAFAEARRLKVEPISIERAFYLAARALIEADVEADNVKIEYHGEFGFPSLIYIHGSMDDGSTIRVTHFEPLP